MFDAETRHRLFYAGDALGHPVVAGVLVTVVIALIMALLLVRLLKLDDAVRRELTRRTLSWMVLMPLLLGPVLLGAAWVILGVGVLSLLLYREFARVTGLFREKAVSATVVVGILGMTFAVFDHWYVFFAALGHLTAAAIAAIALLQDQPKGYVQRVAMGVFGIGLFGIGLGHLGYMANDGDYRPILTLILVSVALNDVFAYLCGKAMGRRKLCPNTSPNKTLAGSLGSLVLTTGLVMLLGREVFTDGLMHRGSHLMLLGVIISVSGQVGDLMLSAIKRDIGIKDTGNLIPGHGGLLDRFDSLLLVAPATFHFINYFRGIGLDQTPRIITGG